MKKILLASLVALVFPTKTDTTMFKSKSVASTQTDVFEIPEGELLVRDVPYGFAIVSHKISKDKFPIRFLYRETPRTSFPDSGWRIFSGYEDDDYTNDPNNFSVYSLTRLANYQYDISGDLLYSDIGSVFEKAIGSDKFEPVTDWTIPNE